jgi:putative membrane protein
MAIVLWQHQTINRKFLIYVASVFVLGFVAEYFGVVSGVIFGQYFYGQGLGYSILGIPVIIGANWLMLSYSASNTMHWFLKSMKSSFAKKVVSVIGASLLMVFVDLFMEICAPFFDFWYFKNRIAPFQNYVAWFCLAIMFNFFYEICCKPDINRVAVILFLLQLLFFVSATYSINF